MASFTSRSDETTVVAGTELVGGVGVAEVTIAGLGVDGGSGKEITVGSGEEVLGGAIGLGVAAAPQAMATDTSSPKGRNRIELPVVKKFTLTPPVKSESGIPKSTGRRRAEQPTGTYQFGKANVRLCLLWLSRLSQIPLQVLSEQDPASVEPGF